MVNPFDLSSKKKAVVSVVANMLATPKVVYDAKADNVTIDLSIGVGKSSTKVEITNYDAADVAESLRNFDPNRSYSKAEIISRTIERVDPMIPVMVDGEPEKDAEGKETGREIPDPDEAPYIRFLTSTKKNTRYVNVPVAEWDSFCDNFDALSQNIDNVLDQARDNHEKIQAEERKREAAKAAKAANAGK